MLRPGKDKGLATPVPLGMAALASTTFLMGVALVFFAPVAWAPYLLQALLFGGLVAVLAGMWAFAYGDPLAATTFTFVGAFYSWWGLVHMTLFGIHAAAAVAASATALVFIVSAVVVLYLWIASFYESAAFNLALLFLWIGFGLVGIGMLSGVEPLTILGGISAIISGLIGAYDSFGEIYNAASLEEVIPLGEPRIMRERVEHDEVERIRRLHAAGPEHHQAA